MTEDIAEVIDIYWSPRSPYSYLATPRLRRLQESHAVRCRVRPVYPHAVRNPELSRSRGELWLSYFKRDIVRTAEFLGMPIAWPRPDPVDIDPETGEPRPDQPRLKRLAHLICAADERGRGIEFIDALTKRLWSPGTADWWADDTLASSAGSAGLDIEELDAEISADPEKFERVVEGNQRRELEAGHWGAPVMVFRGEPFFGQDRIDQLVWRLDAAGLRREGPLR